MFGHLRRDRSIGALIERRDVRIADQFHRRSRSGHEQFQVRVARCDLQLAREHFLFAERFDPRRLQHDDLLGADGVFEDDSVAVQVQTAILGPLTRKRTERLRTRIAFLADGLAPFVGFLLGIGLARHKLFNFFVQRVAAEGWVIFLNFQFFQLQFFVAGGGVARR